MKKYPKARVVNSEIKGEEVLLYEKDIVPPKDCLSSVRTRCGGNLNNKGLFLYSIYDWQVVKDDLGELVLVATYMEKSK